MYSLQYLYVTDAEYAAINPKLAHGVWEIDAAPSPIPPAPTPTPLPPGITSTDDLPEGEEHLYFTDTRAQDAFSITNLGTGLGLFKGLAAGSFDFYSLTAGPGIALTHNGDNIVVSNTGGGGGGGGAIPSVSLPTSVGTIAMIGNDVQHFALADHQHQGLTSLGVNGQQALHGAVTLVPGANISLSQSGQNITVSAPPGMAIGTPIAGAATGSLLFAGSSGLAQDGAHLFWDSANVRLGIGTSTPQSSLSVAGLVESTSGGFKFPDGSIQTTASTGESDVATIDATLTPAQIQSLHTAPVQLLPAPGPGLYTVVDSVEMKLVFNTTPYSGGGSDLFVDFLTTPAENLSIDGNILLANRTTTRFGEPVFVLPDTVTMGINQAVVLSTTSPFTGGDSTLKVRLRYKTYTAIS